jgi:polyhydroxyalkanoate synthase subunit PhaC
MKEKLTDIVRGLELGTNASRAWNLVRGPARAKVAPTPSEVVWEENKWKLLRYQGGSRSLRTPVLLVPSLINRHYVLDLAPGKSVVEYLVAQGHDVYIIDWGTPGPEDRFLTLDDIALGYVGRAVRRVARDAWGRRVHVLGYCLGGTLAAMYTAHSPELVASLTALAAPVSFAHGGMLTTWSRSPGFDLGTLVEATGNVPWPLMQTAFHLLRPTLGLSKLVHAWDRGHDSEFVQGFFALERWGNDNVSFPGAAYADYIRRLYIEDALVRGEMRLGGEKLSLATITCPTLVVSFAHDIIVPKESAAPLLDLVGAKDKRHLELSGGHVGAVVARKAATTLWPELSRFFRDHEGAVAPKKRAPKVTRAEA